MPLIRTEAIVLQSRNFSETSKIIMVFTRDKGRVSIMVKGGRKGSKKFPGGLETLNRVDLQFYHRGGRELQNYKLADLIESYGSLRKNLATTYTALSLAETVQKTTPLEDANAALYDVLAQSFAVLNGTAVHPWTIRWAALLRICRALGFGMALADCRRCGSKGPMRGFSLEHGGFVCSSCQRAKAEPVAVLGETWGVLRFLESCALDIAPRMVVAPRVGRRIEAFFLHYLRYHVSGLKGFATWKVLQETYWGTSSPVGAEETDG